MAVMTVTDAPARRAFSCFAAKLLAGSVTGFPMPTTFLGLMWQSFLRINGPICGVGGIAISLLLWLIKPDARIPVVYVVLATTVLGITLFVLVDAGRIAWGLRSQGLPKVIYATTTIPGLERVRLVCLLEPSEMFSYGVQVSFYYLSPDGFELFVGSGRVINIQDDRRIQVGLTRAQQGQEDTVNAIAQNTKTVLDRVRVKPTVPHDMFGATDEEVHE